MLYIQLVAKTVAFWVSGCMPKCNHGCTVAFDGCIDATTEGLDFKGFKNIISRLCNRHATRTLAVACIPPVYRRGGMQPMAAWVKKCARNLNLFLVNAVKLSHNQQHIIGGYKNANRIQRRQDQLRRLRSIERNE